MINVVDETTKTKETLFEILETTGALKFGDFTLASGAKSKYYIDLRIIPNFPEQFDKMTDEAVKYIQKTFPEVEGIVGIPMAAIPYGTIIAYKLKKPYYILRKESKDHGLKKCLRGQLKKGKKFFLLMI